MRFVSALKSLFLAIALVILVVACRSEPEVTFHEPRSGRMDATGSAQVSASTASSISSTSSASPKSVQINVPFASQAPFANWADPYQEACEEASLILVHHYLSGAPLGPAIMDAAILDLIAWEIAHGYSQDVTVEELAQIARDYYGYSATVRMDVSEDGIKEFLSSGVPVILPLAGRDLGNPYYSGEGPWYHMLVVTGYDSDEFITNDVGTKRGQGYRYSYDVLLSAVHDWTGVKEEIRKGRRTMLIVQ